MGKKARIHIGEILQKYKMMDGWGRVEVREVKESKLMFGFLISESG